MRIVGASHDRALSPPRSDFKLAWPGDALYRRGWLITRSASAVINPDPTCLDVPGRETDVPLTLTPEWERLSSAAMGITGQVEIKNFGAYAELALDCDRLTSAPASIAVEICLAISRAACRCPD